ncbi:hypothetical protein NQ318_004537 [Aromia moschata]|uniref:DUF4817 domain-containing protein n=1 Tax=Aromia moschata TaxID=1265417 RepID=A0AAV8XNG6_9CUCU|nr:hypothetical protein NQ318_004537 [Aromia moschata]
MNIQSYRRNIRIIVIDNRRSCYCSSGFDSGSRWQRNHPFIGKENERILNWYTYGCGDKTRTQKQVCEICNTKYPDRRISQSSVSRIENKFREFGNITDIPKSGKKRTLDDEQKLDIMLDIHDNSHKPTRQVAADNDVKLTDDDPDRRLEFCEIMANRCQDNPLFIKKKNILFSDKATFVLNGTVYKQNCRY